MCTVDNTHRVMVTFFNMLFSKDKHVIIDVMNDVL